MTKYQYLTLREAPQWMIPAAEWFHSKWRVPTEAYLECMEAYLRISVNTEDLETDAGKIYSNDDIKQYIEEKYGFKVHSAYIGQVREKLGIREHENYNDSHTSPRKPCVCPEEKEAAIMDALKHFGFIS